MSLNCYSPTKRRVASPKKSSVTKSPDKEKPYAALDETQRSHAYRYNIGNNFYREQVDRDNATKTQSSSPDKNVFADALCEKSLPPEPETDSAPGTTVTTFMMQMNQPEFGQRQAPFRLVPETDEEALPTTRALIESRSEARLLRMMAQKTEISKYHTPPPYDSDDDTPPNAPRPLSSKDIPHKRKVSVPESTKTSFPNGSQSEKSLRHKSAKPPLGVDSPQGSASTSTSSNEPRPAAESQHQILTKAAKILGTSTSTGNHSAGSKWVLNLHRRKTQKGHANATSSLPKQVHELNEEDMTALPSTLLTSNSAEPNRNISFGGTTRVAIDNSFSNRYQRLVREESDVTLPPTPPAKDTPPHIKDALTALPQEDPDHLAGLGINTAEDNDEVSNMDFAKDAVNGSKSESALFKHGAAEHAKLIHASPSLYSMQASVVGSRRGSKEHTLLPDGVRLSRQHDGGLTKEGYLPPTLYSSDEYSPSIYSPVFKTAEAIDLGKKARLARLSKLRAIADSSPTHSNASDSAKHNHSHVNPDNNIENHGQSAECVPIVYLPSTGESVSHNEHAGEIADPEDLVAQFSLPPRASSLNWQEEPPSGTHLSLLSPNPRTALAGSELSITIPNRVADLALSNMSGSMRHDYNRPSCDEAGNDKLAFNQPSSTSNGTDGTHANSDIDRGHQSSNSIEHNPHRSIGLTPYLTQQLGGIPNPMTPGFNHPSAMPSPLSGPFPPTIPADIPSHEQLLTHFHVLHYHIDDVVRVFRDLQKSSEEEIIGDNEKRFNDMRSAMDEYFADVRSHLNAIEHNMGRATGETENLKNALETHVRSVDDHVYKPMRKLTNQNTELIKKVDSLQERVTHLEKKLENNMPIYRASENGDRNRPAGVDGPAPSFGRPWGGYDAARHMVPVHQQQQQQQQQQDHQYTDVGGRYYNGPDAQHHNYQDGYYANGSYNNYMRRH